MYELYVGMIIDVVDNVGVDLVAELCMSVRCTGVQEVLVAMSLPAGSWRKGVEARRCARRRAAAIMSRWLTSSCDRSKALGGFGLFILSGGNRSVDGPW